MKILGFSLSGATKKTKKTSCFLCLEKTIKKRSKTCNELSDFDFLICYMYANRFKNEYNKNSQILAIFKSKENKQITKCMISMIKYMQRILICGAKYSYRKQRLNKFLYNLYH
tara:strand:+ start:1351 stop:1689 length:339 start_codon:yes stop_codon:yes gene_type:complete